MATPHPPLTHCAARARSGLARHAHQVYARVSV
jgi:hypothetical protein